MTTREARAFVARLRARGNILQREGRAVRVSGPPLDADDRARLRADVRAVAAVLDAEPVGARRRPAPGAATVPLPPDPIAPPPSPSPAAAPSPTLPIPRAARAPAPTLPIVRCRGARYDVTEGDVESALRDRGLLADYRNGTLSRERAYAVAANYIRGLLEAGYSPLEMRFIARTFREALP